MFAFISFLCLLIYASSSERNLTHSEIVEILTANETVDATEISDEYMLESIYGNITESTDPSTIDTALLEYDNIKEIVAKATRKSIKEHFSKQAIYGRFPFFVLCMDLMKQSVYGTRYRLQATKRFRKRYGENSLYQMGLLYGVLMQLRLKMDSVINTLYRMNVDVKFLWFLVLHERMLALCVDAQSMVERIFAIHEASKADDECDEAENYDVVTSESPSDQGMFLPGG